MFPSEEGNKSGAEKLALWDTWDGIIIKEDNREDRLLIWSQLVSCTP